MTKIYYLSFLTLISITLLIHCNDRKRLNPLDPQNPDTKGKPTGLRILSEFDTITLRWNSVNVDGLVGYHIYRKLAETSSYQLIHLAPADSNIFYDRHVTYNNTYTYKVSVVTSTYESQPSDSLSITPGPTVIWVADADNRRIIKISHDGLHEIERIAVTGLPWDIYITSDDRSIWFSDVLFGDIYRIQGEEWDRQRPGHKPLSRWGC